MLLHLPIFRRAVGKRKREDTCLYSNVRSTRVSVWWSTAYLPILIPRVSWLELTLLPWQPCALCPSPCLLSAMESSSSVPDSSRTSQGHRLRDYVHRLNLNEETIRVLAAHGHLDTSFLQIFDFPPEPTAEESEETSEAESLRDDGHGRWTVFTRAHPEDRRRERRERRSQRQAQAQATVSPPEAQGTSTQTPVQPRSNSNADTVMVYKCARSRKFHRQHSHHLRRQDVGPFMTYELCRCARKHRDPSTAVWADAYDVIHMVRSCHRFRAENPAEPQRQQVVQRVQHCRQCTDE